MFVKKNTPQFNLIIEEAVKNNTAATLTAAGSVAEGNLTICRYSNELKVMGKKIQPIKLNHFFCGKSSFKLETRVNHW